MSLLATVKKKSALSFVIFQVASVFSDVRSCSAEWPMQSRKSRSLTKTMTSLPSLCLLDPRAFLGGGWHKVFHRLPFAVVYISSPVPFAGGKTMGYKSPQSFSIFVPRNMQRAHRSMACFSGEQEPRWPEERHQGTAGKCMEDDSEVLPTSH